jgi:hypothetical protein
MKPTLCSATYKMSGIGNQSNQEQGVIQARKHNVIR